MEAYARTHKLTAAKLKPRPPKPRFTDKNIVNHPITILIGLAARVMAFLQFLYML